ncbi:MAG TPA: DUF1232 domain-containing protein [Syntrophomonas sp.]|jgi:uncharacterized membrane protein YkvA (DUF1232 family)|nr:DUF1232 domain-containing protein [Syntrophomonas sp.]
MSEDYVNDDREFEQHAGESQEDYVNRGFFKKAKKFAAKVPLISDAVAMYNTLKDNKTPIWAKATITAALAYFIMPADAIPDIIAAVGFVDDAGTIAAAMAAISSVMTDEHRKQANDWLNGVQ